MIIDNKKNTF